MTQRVIIIGGGFAGLSAGTALAEKGYQVTVLEGRQLLGGRAYSFTDNKTGDPVDNGQHLFMGCYHATQDFLRRIGTLHLLRFQNNLTVDFAAGGGRHAALRCWPLPAPLHLFSGLLGLSTLSWGDRFRLLYVKRALDRADAEKAELERMTVREWLKRNHQSDRACRHLWDLIAIATLNEDPAIASAAPFVDVLKLAFFSTRKDSQLGLAAVGLSDLYVHAARCYIEERGGQVQLKAPVDRLLFSAQQVVGVELRDGSRLSADWVISAVPAPALLRMLPATVVEQEPVFARLTKLTFAPIISIHLWYDRVITRKPFVGMLDTHLQWFFNRSKVLADVRTGESYICAVISGAHAFVDWPEGRILAMAREEIRRLFSKAEHATLLRSLVIKEHQATLSPAVGYDDLRPGPVSPLSNLLLAGDWTQTGLPATIESACVSGHACAKVISESESVVQENVKEAVHA